MQVSIVVHQPSDTKLFYKYLFEESYLEKWGHVKNSILEIYPELQSELKNITDKEEGQQIIETFIATLYDTYGKSLDSIATKLQTKFDSNTTAIVDAFFATMDVDINDLSLQIMISMLPRSLFSEKNIVLSVVSEIIHEKDRPYMEIFLHEMSHLLRNNIMKQFPNEAELSPLAKEDLKEIMAPVILRDKHFDAILDSKHFRQANQKQEMLTIGVGKDIFTIVNYFEDIYQRGKKEGKTFQEIFEIFVRIFKNIESQIIEKHNIYNSLILKMGRNTTFLQQLEIEGYSDPIQIT